MASPTLDHRNFHDVALKLATLGLPCEQRNSLEAVVGSHTNIDREDANIPYSIIIKNDVFGSDGKSTESAQHSFAPKNGKAEYSKLLRKVRKVGKIRNQKVLCISVPTLSNGEEEALVSKQATAEEICFSFSPRRIHHQTTFCFVSKDWDVIFRRYCFSNFLSNIYIFIRNNNTSLIFSSKLFC